MRRHTRAALGVLGCALLACCALSAPALLLGMDAGQTALCWAYLCLCVALTHGLCVYTRALWQYVPACALACAAAALLPVLPELLRAFADYRMLVYAVVLIVVMLATNSPALRSALSRVIPHRRHANVKKEGESA